MGTIHKPPPAMGLIATLGRNLQVLAKALDALVPVLGEVTLVQPAFNFHWTDYYQKEMGSDLIRRFIKINTFVDRSILSDLKIFTNRIEQKLALSNGDRQINLDPGLLTADNLILATTKNRSHRIYLNKGIFAEVTLWYVRGDYEALEWTYPDYRSDEVRNLLKNLRKDYLHTIRSPGFQNLPCIESINPFQD